MNQPPCFELNAELAAFLASERDKVSPQGFLAITKLVKSVGTWLRELESSPDEVGIADALAWQCQLVVTRKADGKLLAPGTVNNHLKAAKRFFDYLVYRDFCSTNPFRELRRVKVGDHLSDNALTVEDMGKLLDGLGRFNEPGPWWIKRKAYRVHVIAELLYATGMRPSEAAALEPRDLDLVAQTVWIRSGKNGQGRSAFLTSYATAVLTQYLPRRVHLFGSYERQYAHTLFGAGAARLASVVNEVLATTTSRLGLPLITSYGFRTSLGAHLVEAGCDLRHVQLLVGLRTLGSTQSYVRRTKASLRHAVDGAHPRANWEPRV